MWIAISVELGPGIKLVAPSKSRNSWSVNHLRRTTTSSCMIAICAAGPPKAVNPSLRKSPATSARLDMPQVYRESRSECHSDLHIVSQLPYDFIMRHFVPELKHIIRIVFSYFS